MSQMTMAEFAEFVNARIQDSMARTLFVSAFADHRDDSDAKCPGEQAGPGQNWMDVAPETSHEAKSAAAALATQLASANGDKSPADLVMDAALADGHDLDFLICGDDDALAYMDDFGYCLAMQAMGHGISWEDDHAAFEIEIPHVEFHVWSCDACEGQGGDDGDSEPKICKAPECKAMELTTDICNCPAEGYAELIETSAGEYVLNGPCGDSQSLHMFQWPEVAAQFGYVACDWCKGPGSEDSVGCPHKLTNIVVKEAQKVLSAHVGDLLKDPGFFT